MSQKNPKTICLSKYVDAWKKFFRLSALCGQPKIFLSFWLPHTIFSLYLVLYTVENNACEGIFWGWLKVREILQEPAEDGFGSKFKGGSGPPPFAIRRADIATGRWPEERNDPLEGCKRRIHRPRSNAGWPGVPENSTRTCGGRIRFKNSGGGLNP